MNIRFLYIFWTLCFTSVCCANAQNYNLLPELEKQHIRLQSHLLFYLDSVDLSAFNSVLEKKIPIAVYLSQHEDKNKAFVERFKKYGTNFLVLSNVDSDNINYKNLNVIYINKEYIDSVFVSKNILLDSLNKRFNEFEELSLVHVDKDLDFIDSLFMNLWTQSGKLPNFIYVNNFSLEAGAKVVQMLNEQQKVFGVLRTEEELLTNVSFEFIKNRNVSGFFSFPYEGTAIIPHKAGYYFSPDIIIPTLENQPFSKEFMAYPLEPNYALSYHFTFGETVINNVVGGNNDFLSNDVISKRDSIHGNVGYFTDRAYIDTGITGKTALESNFSITAWIKPTTLNFANGILGKGYNFVVKIHEGHLTFTSAGIKDYISLSSPIPVDKWTHIALVYSSVNHDLTFFINGKRTDRIEMISEYEISDFSLLVGNNIWEEFFTGYLSDVKIWERELNDSEVQAEFKFIKKEVNTSWFTEYYVVILGGFVLLIGILAYFKIRTRRFQSKKKKFQRVDRLSALASLNEYNNTEYKEQILCLGQLKILNTEGENIASKFSPMLKKLFILIFLNSQSGNQGISTKNLTEAIWPGMNFKKAKNTRGTTIQNLRGILSSCCEIELIFKDKLWYLKTSSFCYFDFNEVRALLDLFKVHNYDYKVLQKELPRMLKLLYDGRYFSNSSEPWLDLFVEKFSIEIIEECFTYSEKLSLKNDSETLFEISEVICIYDDLNEKALKLKLKVLVFQGKFSLARTVYDNFIKLYKNIYREEYMTDFDQLIS